jgi:outer membrane lipoprotein-sorting protein
MNRVDKKREKSMHSCLRRPFSGRLSLAVLLAVTAIPGHAFAAGDLKATLARLDAAAAGFRSTTANFEFTSIQTDPVPDKDVQTGVVYYQRTGSNFQMGLHIDQVNGEKAPRIIVCCQGGNVRLFDEKMNHVTVLNKISQYQSWFMLGFGASGRELAEKFDIADDGVETVDGVKTEKLEMIPRDANVRRNVAKITLWMDLDRGVSLKQRFDEDPSHYRVCAYSNIRMNQSVPRDAFTFRTNKQTTVSSQ